MQEKVMQILKNVIYPNFQKDIVSFGFVKNVSVENGAVSVDISIPSSSNEIVSKLGNEVKLALKNGGFENSNVNISTPQAQEAPKPQTKNIAPQIKHFVMISSGKGGVGKSTTSVNLSIALAQAGKKVGLLDADIYGPNIPRMMGVKDNKAQVDENLKKIIPLKSFGVEVMSIGSLYEEGQSLIWRGPMIMRAISQLLTDVLWSELDVLVIDMPPGTGDAQLTLAQSVPVSAGVVVTTPQAVSLDDSARSLDMFAKLNIPIAGMIENMSGFICPDCGKEYDIFGKGGAKALADKFDTQILASVPLEPQIREGGDNGKPMIFFSPESKSSSAYKDAANALLQFLQRVDSQNLADNKNIQPVK